MGVTGNSSVVTLLIERSRGAVVGLLARGRAVAREAARPRPVLIGLAVDAFRSREELLVENALLRQQLIVAARAVTRPKFRGYERGLIVFFAAFARHWAPSRAPPRRWSMRGGAFCLAVTLSSGNQVFSQPPRPASRPPTATRVP